MTAVNFDPKIWGRLATLADNQNTTIPDLIERAIERMLVGTTRSQRTIVKETRANELIQSREAHRTALITEIRRLRDNGHTIQTIADITGYSKTYVSRILCENGARSRTRSPNGTRR